MTKERKVYERRFQDGTTVVLTRRKARVWLDDTGELDHLPSGLVGTVTGQVAGLTVVDFSTTKWAGRPVKVRPSELRVV